MNYVLRAHDQGSVIVLMGDTLAVVHAELLTPLTQSEYLNAQAIHALRPVKAEVELGPYDMGRTRFTNCRVRMEIPEVRHERIDYTRKRNIKF